MDSEIQGEKTKDMQDVDNYRDIPTIDVKRLLLALAICGVVLVGAVLLLP